MFGLFGKKKADPAAAAALCGYAAAHAVWSVSEGESLIAFCLFDAGKGERRLVRFAHERIEEGAAAAAAAFEQGGEGAENGAFAVDAFYTENDQRVDALILTARSYASPVPQLKFAIPYRPAGAEGGFAVYRPRLIEIHEIDREALSPLMDAFFDGRDGHEQAAAVWAAHDVGAPPPGMGGETN